MYNLRFENLVMFNKRLYKRCQAPATHQPMNKTLISNSLRSLGLLYALDKVRFKLEKRNNKHTTYNISKGREQYQNEAQTRMMTIYWMQSKTGQNNMNTKRAKST